MKQSELRKLIRETIEKEYSNENVFKRTADKIFKKFDDRNAERERQYLALNQRAIQRERDELKNNLPDGPITKENWGVVEKYILFVWKNGGDLPVPRGTIGKGVPAPEKYSFEEYVNDHPNWPNNALDYHDDREELADHLDKQYAYGSGNAIPFDKIANRSYKDKIKRRRE